MAVSIIKHNTNVQTNKQSLYGSVDRLKMLIRQEQIRALSRSVIRSSDPPDSLAREQVSSSVIGCTRTRKLPFSTRGVTFLEIHVNGGGVENGGGGGWIRQKCCQQLNRQKQYHVLLCRQFFKIMFSQHAPSSCGLFNIFVYVCLIVGWFSVGWGGIPTSLPWLHHPPPPLNLWHVRGGSKLSMKCKRLRSSNDVRLSFPFISKDNWYYTCLSQTFF